MRNALAFIHAHLTDDRLSVARIADAAATSPFYLNHAFGLALGRPIWRYVLRERARHAAELMRGTTTSLAAVAQSAGFSTYPSFIEAIRREFGQTPNQLYRCLA